MVVDDKQAGAHPLRRDIAGAWIKMASDSDREHKIRLRVSNHKAYVWDVEGGPQMLAARTCVLIG